MKLRPTRLIAACAIALTLAAAGCSQDKKPDAAAVPTQQAIASDMINLGSDHAGNFLKYSQAEGIRNMIGGARGIFISPSVTGGAAFVGYETGTGFLMRRHGSDWSDPVFFTLSGTSAGFQAGAKQQKVMVLLMTDAAVDSFVKGEIDLGGTGGFAIGSWGVGVSGTGQINGGLEQLTVTINEGAFLGAAWPGIKANPAKQINDAAYGPNTDLMTILNAHGGRYAPAKQVRAKLTAIVLQAWDVEARSVAQAK